MAAVSPYKITSETANKPETVINCNQETNRSSTVHKGLQFARNSEICGHFICTGMSVLHALSENVFVCGIRYLTQIKIILSLSDFMKSVVYR
jgi:hypothetical protein